MKRKIYMAVGRYHLCRNKNGMLQPIVIVNNKEKALNIDEMILWSLLEWTFRGEKELKRVYTYTAENAGRDANNYEDILQRLIARDLVVYAEGRYEDTVIYHLFKDLQIIPIKSTLGSKLWVFINLILKEKVSISNAAAVLERDKFTELQKSVMKLTRKNKMTVAEVLKYMNDSEIDESIADNSRTPKNRLEMKSMAEVGCFPWMNETHGKIMESITDLYLGRSIVFDKVI